MCSPERFRVEYVINPWMSRGVGHTDSQRAQDQWSALHTILFDETDSRVTVLDSREEVPDMVFSANAGLVYDGTFIPSRFRYAERAGEEPHFTDWADSRGMKIRSLPDGMTFEGAGDALFDRIRPILWLGHGFRTSSSAEAFLSEVVQAGGWKVVPLELTDPRFYHLDTCFCPLDGGLVMWFPEAFSAESRDKVCSVLPESGRIEVGEDDAALFACNAVCVNGTIVMNRASQSLTERLQEHGFRVIETPLDEFIKAGGSSKCLTLRLDEPVVNASG